MSGAKKLLYAAAGGGDDPVYVEDVFSIYLYGGNDGSQTITNGIDLDGEGGMVWQKRRGSSENHVISDSARGVSSGNYKDLHTNLAVAENTDASPISAFNSNGFAMDRTGEANADGERYVSWTFRKTEKFFDIVEYTGNGSNQSIAHNLGATPGFVVVKSKDQARNWSCWHNSIGDDKYILLNSTATIAASGATRTVNSTHYQIFGSWNDEGISGEDYVMYLFAHNAESFGEDSDESIINCGTYLGSNSSDVEVDLGWEPQWLMIKNTERTDTWTIIDNMRGLHARGEYNDNYLAANSNAAEETGTNHTEVIPTATGFIIPTGASGHVGEADEKYVFIAIRRPHKPPEAGTDVFSPYAYQDAGLTSGSGTAVNRTILNGGSNSGTNFPVDMYWHKGLADTSYGFHVFDRLRGKGEGLLSDLSNGSPAGDSASNSGFDFMEGVDVEYNGTMYYYSHAAGSREHIGLFFKRAPTFFDIVAYKGNSTSGNEIKHSLGAVPKMILIKRYIGSRVWIAYFDPLGNTKYLQASGASGAGQNAAATSSAHWNDTSPTASVFTLGNSEDVNGNLNYIAYLFGDAEGVSKVGTYDSDGSNNIAVTTGFSPRFVMVKNVSDASTNWIVFDTAQGMTTSDVNKSLEWNLSNATNTSSDLNVHTSSTGFTAKRGSPHLNHSDSGKSYVYLAIA